MPSYRTIPKLLLTSTCLESLIERGSYELDVNFSYRQAADAHDSLATTNATMALIKSLKGRSIVWNLLVLNGNFSEGTTGWTAASGQSAAVSDGVLQLTTRKASASYFTISQNRSFVNGHKYFIDAFVRLDSQTEFPSTAKIRAGYFSSPTTWFTPIPLINVQNKWFHYRDIIGVTNDKTAIIFAIYKYSSSLTFSSDDTAKFKNLMCIDLTLIYGEGNEPSTAEEFEQDYFNWFGKPLTYEAYTAGELRNLNMVGIKTQGFNLLGSGTMPIKWNQLVQNGDFSDGTTGWVRGASPITLSVKNGVVEVSTTNAAISSLRFYQSAEITSGHQYCIIGTLMLELQGSFPANASIRAGYFNSPTKWFLPNIQLTDVQNQWYKFRSIVAATDNYTSIYFSAYATGNSFSFSSADIAKFKNLMCIDLTLIYGEGNEPTTAEQFEADYKSWFGKELTYEAYNEGTEMNVPVGKTLVMADTPYQISGDFTTITDSQGTAITPDAQGLFTPTENTEVTVSGVGSDTCLHFVHSGRRNGEYESHWEETQYLDLTKVKGKLDGTGSSVYVCPQGLLQAGAIRDEIYIQDGKRWFAKRVERRAYQSGDAQSSTMTTDGVSYTNEALATPEYYLLDDEWQDDSVWSYNVDDWGTEEVVNSSIGVSAPIEGTIKYYNPLRLYSYGLRQNEIACVHDAQVVKDIYKNGILSLHNNIWDFFPINSALSDNGKERYFRIYSTIEGIASKPSILNIGSAISSVKIIDKSNDGNYIVGVKTNGLIETDATKYAVTLMNDYGVSFKIYLLPSDYWSIGEMTFSNATTLCEYFFIGSSTTLTANSLNPGYIFRAPRLLGYNFSKLATYSNPAYGFPETSTVTFTYPVSYPYSVSDSCFSPIHIVDYDLSASDLDSVYTPMYSYNSELAKGADGAHPSNFVTGQYIYIVKRTGKLLTVLNNNSSNNGFTIYSALGIPEYSKVTINLSTGGLSNTTLA